MAKQTYNDKLKVRIGRVTASAEADNYFPVAGETVTINAATAWGQTSEWQIQDGSGNTTAVAGNLANNKDNQQILIAGGGELQQKFIGRNNLAEASVIKTIYAISPQSLPYFSLTASKEIVRADGEATQIRITPELGYTGAHTMIVRIYEENETTIPAFSFTDSVQADGYKYVEFSTSTAVHRGIYDVEVDVIDTATGKMLSKRIDKLITVTPKLCPKPADTTQGYEVVATYRSQTSYGGAQTFELRLWQDVDGSGLHYAEATLPLGDSGYGSYDRIPIHLLPAGTTLCLRKDAKEPDQGYPCRFLPTGNNDVNMTNENGSPNFTYEAPLVITHDTDTVMEWKWWAYGAVNLANNIHNVVLDGRGYHNTSIRFSPDETKSSNSCFFLVAGTSDFEMFACDIDGAGFTGISAKTDPGVNQPHFWRSSGWKFENLRIHHCTLQKTAGEGVYLGYYGSGKLSGMNSSGTEATYYAHLLDKLRLYRCDFINTGLDSIQVNNSINVDICYCNTTGSGASKQGGQNYASSSVFDGRMYNCRFLACNGPIAYCGPLLGECHIYNNVMVAGRYAGAFVSSLWKSSQDEHIDLDGDGVVDEIGLYIYNNVIKAYSLGSLNTDYVLSKYLMDDNVIITEVGNDKVPAMFTGDGNIFIKSIADYSYINQQLKIADSANNNYQPAYNSSLVTSGAAGRSRYDIRGYRNWYNSKMRTGPYMGIYKDTGIVDVELQLTGISLNNGDTGTTNQNVSVRFACFGTPIRYRLSESADLSTVAWQSWNGNIVDFVLSDVYGDKTVYAQVATATVESEVKSATISYADVITFADAGIKAICLARWDVDGDGEIISSEAAAVPTITTIFKAKTNITSFNELRYFTSVTAIDSQAFQGCTNLAEITLPDTIRTIGSNAFNGCTALQHINIPEGVTVLDSCFTGSGLVEVKIPDSVTMVKAFSNCASLIKADIGTGVTAFGQNAFNGCTALQIFIIRATAIPAYAGWTLPDAFAGNIYVPDGLVDAYKTASGWKNFAARYKPLSEYIG